MTTDKIRIRRCLIKVGILDTYIARRLTAPLRRAVYSGSIPGQCLKGCACEGAVPHVRGSCEPVPEVIPIGKRPNSYTQKTHARQETEAAKIDLLLKPFHAFLA
jgi:hypothetical protein